MRLDAVEFIRRFLVHALPAGFIKIRHFGLLANRNRRQALDLCRSHLHATAPDNSALLTAPQKSALNRSCPQCKRGTLHVVARQPADGSINSHAPLACAHFDSS
jgi:Putative transposase